MLLSFLLIAPLITTFLANYLVEIGIQNTLAIACTVPAVLLSMTSFLLEESSIFIYKDNKILAFNLINAIAKINQVQPVLVDLSRSTWLKYDHYNVGLFDALGHPQTQSKMLIGSFMMFTFFFNNRLAQISLD